MVSLLVTAAELSVASPVVLSVPVPTLPVLVMPAVVVMPVTPSVPPIVALLVTAAESSVARPLVLSVPVPTLPVLAMPAVVVKPLTPSVPPMVSLLVTAAELSVARPLVLSVVVPTLPVLVMPLVVVAPPTLRLAPEPMVMPVPCMVTVWVAGVAPVKVNVVMLVPGTQTPRLIVPFVNTPLAEVTQTDVLVPGAGLTVTCWAWAPVMNRTQPVRSARPSNKLRLPRLR